MNKFLLITKLNILQTFNLTRNSKSQNDKKKSGLKALGIIAIIGYIMWYVFYITKSLLPIFIIVKLTI